MYLSTDLQQIRIYLTSSVSTTEPAFVVSYNDIDANGMILPQSNSIGLTAGTGDVVMVDTPNSGVTRQVVNIQLFNNDTQDVQAVIYLNDNGTQYTLCNIVVPSGNTLQWSRETGWVVFGNTTLQEFRLVTIIANSTYYKPATLKRALICCVGAGGGGGSGRQGANAENRGGGGGGGGGCVVWSNLSNSEIPDQVSCVIGTGGAGGASAINSSSNGTAGTAGGDTIFGGIIVAKGGGGGGAGTLTAGAAGAGGAVANCVPNYSPYTLSAASGSAGVITTSAPAAGGAGMGGSVGCAGGGGAGGITNGNASTAIGGAGGSIYENGVLYAGGTSGISPNGSDNKSKFLFFNTNLTSNYGLGTGGAGGYNSVGTYNGGKGGDYGAGGGGGAATLNGTQSGAGGAGGAGLILILEMY